MRPRYPGLESSAQLTLLLACIVGAGLVGPPPPQAVPACIVAERRSATMADGGFA